MNEKNAALAISLAIDLITRGLAAMALAKRGNVTDAEITELAAQDDAARAALQTEIDSRGG